MIRYIVLDMGNVLLDYNPEFVLNTFCTSEEEKEVIRREQASDIIAAIQKQTCIDTQVCCVAFAI